MVVATITSFQRVASGSGSSDERITGNARGGSLSPYRVKAERPKVVEPMDENTRDAIIVKALVVGAVLLASMALGTCAYVNHGEDQARVEVERYKADSVKAERDRAMFESMKRTQSVEK